MPFFLTQGLGAFNDNVFKNGLAAMLVFHSSQMAGLPRKAPHRPTATIATRWSSPVTGCLSPLKKPPSPAAPGKLAYVTVVTSASEDWTTTSYGGTSFTDPVVVCTPQRRCG